MACRWWWALSIAKKFSFAFLTVAILNGRGGATCTTVWWCTSFSVRYRREITMLRLNYNLAQWRDTVARYANRSAAFIIIAHLSFSLSRIVLDYRLRNVIYTASCFSRIHIYTYIRIRRRIRTYIESILKRYAIARNCNLILWWMQDGYIHHNLISSRISLSVLGEKYRRGRPAKKYNRA